MIASTPTGYAPSRLTSDQIDNYVCSGCRSDADPGRSAEVTARFAASKAAAAAARLRPPFIAIVPGTKRPGAPGTASEVIRVDDGCSCTADVTCAACLLTRAAEAAYGRRVAHDYLGICAMIGHHYDPELLANCPEPTATIAPCEEPAFCTHARPAENCVIHASRLSQSKMPAKRARCKSCLGYHGKTGRDRCPYSQKEAVAVRASRAAAMKIGESGQMATGSRKPPVADFVKIQVNTVAQLHRSNSHLGNASKRLRQKPGRPATGTSKWARLRRKQRRDVNRASSRGPPPGSSQATTTKELP